MPEHKFEQATLSYSKIPEILEKTKLFDAQPLISKSDSVVLA